MDTSAVTSLLPALLEKSLTATILALLLAAAIWGIVKLLQRADAKDKAHAAELSTVHTQRLEDAKDFDRRSKENSDHLRTMVDMQNRVLTNIEHQGTAEKKNRSLLAAIAAELKIPLEQFV